MSIEFLIIFQYHEPEPFRLFEQGDIEEYESSTGVYIEAETAEHAHEWGEFVAGELLRHCNANRALEWKRFGYPCWIETTPEESPWNNCLGFFQRIQAGQLPELDEMDTAAYQCWSAKRHRSD